MQTAFTTRTTILGLASWAIPFILSFAFFDRAGHLLVAQPLFKSIMVLVGGGSGAALLLLALPRLSPGPLSALTLGAYWLAINVALDLATLVTLMHMPIALYFSDIGLRYLMLPIMATAMGAAPRAKRD